MLLRHPDAFDLLNIVAPATVDLLRGLSVWNPLDVRVAIRARAAIMNRLGELLAAYVQGDHPAVRKSLL
jgi:hypothetical protein